MCQLNKLLIGDKIFILTGTHKTRPMSDDVSIT